MNQKSFPLISSLVAALIFSACFFLFSPPFLPLRSASAFNLNCGNDFVSEGASKVDVLKTCGEPIYKEFVGTIKRDYGDTEVEVVIEHWYYTETWRASSQDMRLIFHGSKLVRIERADGRF